MRDRLGLLPEIVPGARGAFEVIVAGRTIFSKLAAGRFPEEEEVLALLSGP